MIITYPHDTSGSATCKLGKTADNRRQGNDDRRDDQQEVERRQQPNCQEVANLPDHCPRLRRTFESILTPACESPPYPRLRETTGVVTLQLAVKPRCLDGRGKLRFTMLSAPRSRATRLAADRMS